MPTTSPIAHVALVAQDLVRPDALGARRRRRRLSTRRGCSDGHAPHQHRAALRQSLPRTRYGGVAVEHDRGVAPLRLRRGPEEMRLPRPAQVLALRRAEQYRHVFPSGEKRSHAPWLRCPRRLLLRLARFRVLSIGRLPGERQPARRHGVGQVLAELLGLGGAPVGRDAHGLEGNDLPFVQAPLPKPTGPGAVQGQRAALVEKAVVQRRGLLLRLRQQEEGVFLVADTPPFSCTPVRAIRRTPAGGRSWSSRCLWSRTE